MSFKLTHCDVLKCVYLIAFREQQQETITTNMVSTGSGNTRIVCEYSIKMQTNQIMKATRGIKGK